MAGAEAVLLQKPSQRLLTANELPFTLAQSHCLLIHQTSHVCLLVRHLFSNYNACSAEAKSDQGIKVQGPGV